MKSLVNIFIWLKLRLVTLGYIGYDLFWGHKIGYLDWLEIFLQTFIIYRSK